MSKLSTGKAECAYRLEAARPTRSGIQYDKMCDLHALPWSIATKAGGVIHP